jgi:hypothetical protein
VSLFSATELQPRKLRRLGARELIQIPTGPSRLVESSTDRRVRARSETWTAFALSVAQSARVRIELLSARDALDAVGCPWSRIYAGSCPASCRCGGSGQVAVGLLVAHYKALVKEFGA